MDVCESDKVIFKKFLTVFAEKGNVDATIALDYMQDYPDNKNLNIAICRLRGVASVIGTELSKAYVNVKGFAPMDARAIVAGILTGEPARRPKYVHWKTWERLQKEAYTFTMNYRKDYLSLIINALHASSFEK